MYVEDVYDDWGLGLVTSLLPDAIPSNASPEATNAKLIYAGAGRAIPAERGGLAVRNRTATAAGSIVLGQFSYKRRDGTIYHLMVGSTGRLDILNNDNTTTNISTSLTAGASLFPAFAVANDLCFFVNGTDRYKLVGTTLRNFGVVRPDAPSASAGAGTGMTGTYETFVTYSVSGTGAESSASDTASVVLAGTGLTVTWLASADAQVTHVNVYLRKPTLGVKFFLVGTVAIGTTTLTVDIPDSAYSALIIPGPDTAENDPPPSGVRYLSWHRARMFAADRTNLYYSKVAKPEAFDPDAYEPINPDDGQPITGLLSFDDVLLILKQDSTWMLVGDDPSTWSVQLLDGSLGCTSFRSLWQLEQTAGWWSEQGPVVLAGRTLSTIGKSVIAPTVGPTAINTSVANEIAAAVDTDDQRVLYLVPSTGSTRLDTILPYNHRLKVWESSSWNPMDLASLAVVENTLSEPKLYGGNYNGQVFELDSGTQDGVASGTVTGTVTGVTSLSTITSTGFDTTGAGLVERYVYVQDANAQLVGRRRITANTSTDLTLSASITGLTAATTYTWIIGAIDFTWSTRWSDFGKPFDKKRFYYLDLQLSGTNPSATVQVDMAYNFDTSAGQTENFTMSSGAASALWDSALWDVATWGVEGVAHSTIRVGRTGRAYRVRVRYRGTDQALELRKLRVRADVWRARR